MDNNQLTSCNSFGKQLFLGSDIDFRDHFLHRSRHSADFVHLRNYQRFTAFLEHFHVFIGIIDDRQSRGRWWVWDAGLSTIVIGKASGRNCLRDLVRIISEHDLDTYTNNSIVPSDISTRIGWWWGHPVASL